MKHQFGLTLLLTACLISAMITDAFAALQPPEILDVKAVDKYITDYVKEKNLPGLSIAIVKDGKTILAKGYGKRSLEENLPVEPDTMSAIGSVSKQFTCACIFLLAEEGKLSVHDPVAKYYPNLTRAKDITLLDLMNHVSGYPDYYPLDFVDRRMRKEIDPDELLRQYAGGKLDFEPGTRYSYSNTGFVLLGRVVEKVSGEPFGEFLSRRILKKLDMKNTFHEPNVSGKQFARGYINFALSDPEYTAPESKGWISAAGAMYSTPSDMVKWDLALMGGKVLKPESYDLMTKPRTLKDGRLSDYGCGIGTRMQNSRPILTHGGAVSGFTCSSMMVPSTKSALIVMCNQDSGLGNLPGQLFALLLKEAMPNVPKIKADSAAVTARKVFAKLQKGQVDRKEFGEEFNLFLTDEKIASASKRLQKFGPVKDAEVLSSNERGGMEVTTTKLTFENGALKILMYRMPSGIIEQYFVNPD